MACDLRFEMRLRSSGHRMVAGVDEAGRGPLAGPVVAAAVVLPEDFAHPVLNDSKKLTARRRERVFRDLTESPFILWACAEVDAAEVDRVNILEATRLAMCRAVEGLTATPDCVLVDGLPVREFPWNQQALVGGDGLSFSIAAASVIAKVTRDRRMIEMAGIYPGYGFESHKGYGTAQHLAQLDRLGPCPIHRQSFRPVAQRALPLDRR